MDKFEGLVPEERTQRAPRRTIPASMLRDACCALRARSLIAKNTLIADIAGWASRAERHGHDMSGFPNVRRWLETLLARPAVQRGLSVKVKAAFHVDMKDPNVHAVLFNQKAR
jgi:GSH-dependent disulfide-bond oxidoreductase